VTTEQPYLRVIADIEDSITAGRLSVGDRIDSERLLAERLGVSRSSVREAIRALSTLGIVQSSVGSGPQAGSIVISNLEFASTSALRLHVATKALPISDIVRTRIMLEAGAYREVIEPLMPDRLQAAHHLISTMDAAPDPSRFLQADLEFHLELVKLAGNVVASVLLTSLRNAISDYVSASSSKLSDWKATTLQLQIEHRKIVVALEVGDGEQAAEIVEQHILGFAEHAGLMPTR
jgi:GntR family transcriptional regulator, transcriptional repressor for pyruvate dehydrogenase complex